MPLRLFSVLIDICLLKRGPQDLPHQSGLTLALLLGALALEAYSASLVSSSPLLFSSVVLSGAFALAATWAILRMRRVESRYWQTLLALVSTGLLFSLLALPLLVAVGPLDPDNMPQFSPLVGLGIVILATWRLLVAGHIWRHALEVPLPVGVLVALGTFMVELILQRALATALAVPAP